MNKNLQIHRIPEFTPEWHEFRKNGIGGSEIGTILGINKYDTAIRLYAEKIGMIEPRQIDNEATFWGHKNEVAIADTWEYYDGSKDGYVQNYKNGNKVRKCRNINGYIINPKYPWLFGSIDRLINKEGGFNLITGEPLETEAILECKNMSYWASQQWEDGIPIYYLAQVTQYMIILETNYAEIVMLVDGGKLIVEKLELDMAFAQRIINISKSFWYDRVLPGKKAFENMRKCDADGDIKGSEKWDYEIQRLEPDPDGSDAYKEYMTEKFVKERDQFMGSIELYQIAQKDRVLLSAKTRIEKERSLCQNQLIKSMVDNGAEAIDFGSMGYVSFSEQKGKQNKRFSNKIKEKPSEDFIEEQFKKLNLNF